MDLRKFSDSLSSLGLSQNIEELVESRKKYLISLFGIKDKVVEKLSDLESSGLKLKEKELFDTLNASILELFNDFYLKYCSDGNSLDFLDDVAEDQDDEHNKIFKAIRLDISKYIFLGTRKDDIFDIVNTPLKFDEIEQFIKFVVYGYLGKLSEFIGKQLDASLFFDDFLKYYKMVILDEVNRALKSCNDSIDFVHFLDIISETMTSVADVKKIKYIYFEFLRKSFNNGFEGGSEFNKEFKFEYADEYVLLVSPYIEQLIKNTYLNDFDISGIDYNDLGVDGTYLANQVLEFIRDNLSDDPNFGASDEDEFARKIYTTYLDDGTYPKRKKTFIDKVKLPISVDNIKILKINDSENIQNYISDLRVKYPKAKNHIGNIGIQEWKSLKSSFIVSYRKKFVDELEKELSDDVFINMSLVQLYTIMLCYLIIVNKGEFDVIPDFENYIKDILLERFIESDSAVRNKEKEKNKRLSEGSQTKKVVEPSTVKLPKILPLQKKEGISSELMEDFNFYFTHIDSDFSDDEKNAIIKAVEKLPGKFYKKNWFRDFGLNDIFFQILDKHGYVCEDDVFVNESFNQTSVVEDLVSSDTPIDNSNDEFSKEIKSLLDEVEKLEDVTKKIDKYFEILKLLGYSFYKKEQKIKDKIVNLSKSNSAFFSSFSNTILNLVNGNQIDEKKEKKWQGMPVYSIDIGGTGYRLICLLRGDDKKKAIYDIMTHKAYITFLDKKCS